jgi:hypothetical protein
MVRSRRGGIGHFKARKKKKEDKIRREKERKEKGE